MRKVLGPPAGAEAFADADGLGVAAAADGAAGALATRAAGVAAADAAAAGDAEAPLSAAGVDGAAATAGGVAVEAGAAGSSVTSSAAGATAGAATAAGAGAAGAARIAPIVAEGPTGGSFWASAGLIAPSASPAVNAVKIAARNADAERARLAETPAAVMLHHAPVISELLQMRAN
jgi:hypothetical protein